MSSPIDDGVVLVTGASSGIGAAIARVVAPRARCLVLVARRKDRLERLAHELSTRHGARAVLVYGCDLVDRGALEAAVQDIDEKTGGVDVLVNSAGVGDLGVYDMADWPKIERMIALNVTSLAYLTSRLVGGMVARGRGGVLNISSGLGLTFLPGMAAYTGTKHFVTGFSEALRLDLAGTGVRVTQVCPGPVATEFEENVGNFLGRSPPSALVISAERCARAAVRAFDRNRALVVPGVLIRFLIWLGAQSPRWLRRGLFAPLGAALRKRQRRAMLTMSLPERGAARDP